MAFDAGSVIAKLKMDTADFKSGIRSAKKETQNFKSDLSSFASTATKVAGVLGVALGASAFVSGVKKCVNASMEMEMALKGLSTTAGAFGQSSDAAQMAAQELASDGLITVSTAAASLRAILSTGLSLDKAVEQMKAYKDEAAFGRASTISYDQAVRNLAESFMTESSMIGNLSGQAENYNYIIDLGAAKLGKKASALTQAERQEAKHLGTMIVAQKAQGDAARLAETFAGKLAVLQKSFYDVKVIIGDSLIPALEMLIGDFSTDLPNAIASLRNDLADFQVAVITLVAGISLLTQVALGFANAVAAVFSLQFEKARQIVSKTVTGISTTIHRAQDKIIQVTDKSYGRQDDIVRRSMDTQADEHSEKSQKVAKDLEKETKKFEKEMEKRERKFKESLANLVRSHLDKRDQLKEDIEDENEDFEERMAERAEDFADRMEDMKDRHEEKVEDIKKQIDDEVAKGAEADQELIADLKARLEEENAEYDESVKKAEEREKKATEKLKKEHEERVNSYQEELNEEEEILKRHQSDVDAVKDQAVEDDITRLKRQYEEENQLAKEEHEERMIEIAERGEQLGDTLGSTINAGLESQKPAIEETMADIGESAGNEFREGIVEGAKKAGEEMLSALLRALGEKAKQAAEGFGGWLLEHSYGGALQKITDWYMGKYHVAGFQSGGIVPGVSGQPRLIMAHPGERIVPANQTREGGSKTISVNVDMKGAIIADARSAGRMGEKIGDGIVKRLQHNVRF